MLWSLQEVKSTIIARHHPRDNQEHPHLYGAEKQNEAFSQCETKHISKTCQVQVHSESYFCRFKSSTYVAPTPIWSPAMRSLNFNTSVEEEDETNGVNDTSAGQNLSSKVGVN